MAILLRKPPDRGIVISGAEVVGSGFLVEILAAVAEGVGIGLAGVLLVAEGIVVVALFQNAAAAGENGNIPVGVIEVVPNQGTEEAPDQVDAPDIVRSLLAVRILRHHIPAIQQEVGVGVLRMFGRSDAGSVVGISRGFRSLRHSGKLIEAVVPIPHSTVGVALLQKIAVCIVGVNRCGRYAASVCYLLRQTVVLIVGVGGGVGLRPCDRHLGAVACGVVICSSPNCRNCIQQALRENSNACCT